MEKKIPMSEESLSGRKAPLGSAEGNPAEMAGFREAKLFLGKDRATLTFFLDEEVASIHYDMPRNEIFYRGHNVKNMTMNAQLWSALERFGEFLAGDLRSQSLQKAYRRCLEHLRADYGLPG